MKDILCKYCGDPIRFKRTRKGKWTPVDQYTGKDHKQECNGLESRLSRSEQERFEHCINKD